MTNIIAEYGDGDTTYRVIKNEHGLYDVWKDNVIVQPNHDAEGIMRYMSLKLHNLFYLKNK